MQEHWTFILLGACVIVLLGLFYYYINRQIQGVQNAQHSLTNHILYQQKVLEKHDQLFSQTLGVPPSFPTEPERQTSRTTPSLNQRAVQVPSGVSMDMTGAPRPVENNSGNSATSAAAAFSSVASLGPMVGTILNMFQTMQPVDGGEEEEATDGEVVPVSGTLSREDLQKELSKELEELQQPSSSPNRRSSTTTTEAEPKNKKREGRVDDTPPPPVTEPVTVVA
jgi:hypothetical protein